MKPFVDRKVSIAIAVALLFAVGSTAFAAVKGDPLKLGLINTINVWTTLTGSVPLPMFRVINTNTSASASAIRAQNTGGGPALDLRVKTAIIPPMTVNSSGKVSNLNVDQLDGFDSTAFMGATTFRVESAVNTGTAYGDGTFVANMSCPAGSLLLSGGPANLSGSSVMVESFPASTSMWAVRINPNGLTDNWNVVVLCARQ
jgi:hypothetical protein